MPVTERIIIISGGQTGADQAALDAAIILGLPHGGWICRGRKTESGPLPAQYRLRELDSYRYRDRTEKNVLDSDGTVIFSFGPLEGGSALTEALTIRHDRPCLVLDLAEISQEQAITALWKWINEHEVRRLNVAGPRASHSPRIHGAVYEILTSFPWEELMR
jgi:predicted Rossmann-fold nucleotide-binding protein